MNRNIFMNLIALCAVFMVFFPSYVFAYSLTTTGLGTTIIDTTGYTFSDVLFDSNTTNVGPLNSSLNYIEADQYHNNLYSYIALSSGYASLGRISGSVFASAQCVGSWDASDSVINGQSASFYNGGWHDQITIASSSLSVGTPVSIRLSYSIDGIAAWSMRPYGYEYGATGYYQYYSAFSWNSGNSGQLTQQLFDNQVGENGVPFNHFFQTVFTDYVGDTGVITGSISLNAGAIGSNLFLYYMNSYTSYCSVDASNTAHYYIDILTPGAYLLSDSGTNYSTPDQTPVPEPNTIVLISIGLLGLGLCVNKNLKIT